ncbi:MAG: RNA 2',3'-cyclic phosphodiesterase [Chloroflexota bacterium]
MRTFIAIELPVYVQEQSVGMIEELKPQFPRRTVRWVRREQLHLTLAFLGETAVSTLPALYQILDKCAYQTKPFTLQLGEMGCFPNCRKPRVLWVGLKGELEPLRKLQSDVVRAIKPLGWEPEKRPYSPHLTLGRIKDKKQHTWRKVTVAKPTAFTVDAIHLVESKLKPTGAVYTIRHSSQFE